jgi:hypothetical protein
MYSPNGRGVLNQFYDLKEMSDRVTNSLGNYTGERLKEYKEDNKYIISKRSQINTLNKRIKIQRDKRKAIINDEKLSAKAKAKKLREIDVNMNKLLKSVPKIRVQANLPLFSTK